MYLGIHHSKGCILHDTTLWMLLYRERDLWLQEMLVSRRQDLASSTEGSWWLKQAMAFELHRRKLPLNGTSPSSPVLLLLRASVLEAIEELRVRKSTGQLWGDAHRATPGHILEVDMMNTLKTSFPMTQCIHDQALIRLITLVLG